MCDFPLDNINKHLLTSEKTLTTAKNVISSVISLINQ